MISVIMPVYNTSAYLDETITCFINQTYKDWEMICVDDGSIDNSVKICEKYAQVDKRIQVIRQEKQGAGAARNRGYEYSKGEYILFWDSDDTCSLIFLEKMYRGITENHTDICICGYTSCDDGYREMFDRPGCIPETPFSLTDLDDDGLPLCRIAPWNKLIRRRLIDRYDIRFQNISSSNDVFFTTVCMCRANKILYLNDAEMICHRISRPGQISENRNPNNLLIALEGIRESVQIENDDELKKKITEFAFKAAVSELRRCKNAKWLQEFYINFMALINSDWVVFKNLSITQAAYKEMFLYDNTASEWWKPEKICGVQLAKHNDILINILSSKKKSVVWGCGKRSDGFLSFCIKEKLNIYAIADRSIEKAHKVSNSYENRYLVISTEQVCSMADLIICANDDVYRYVNSINKSIEKINLQEFCPVI